jgi:DNA polymerase III alpha subunit
MHFGCAAVRLPMRLPLPELSIIALISFTSYYIIIYILAKIKPKEKHPLGFPRG